jgi:MoaA/NifB/PqqE/SkfB family radical SAM enzyme
MQTRWRLHCPPRHAPHVRLEETRNGNLSYVNCRASSVHGPYEGEMDTKRRLRLLNEMAAFSGPIVILAGGKSLFRDDIFEFAA